MAASTSAHDAASAHYGSGDAGVWHVLMSCYTSGDTTHACLMCTCR